MADVPFLLLLFFLVATTVDVDTGLRMVLPPPGGDPPVLADRDMLSILVNEMGEVMIEGEVQHGDLVRAFVARHVANEGRDPAFSRNPEQAVISLKAVRAVPYGVYLGVLDAIKLGYRDLHDAEARAAFGAEDYATYRHRLLHEEPDRVAARYPVRISLAEPPERTN